MPMPPPALSCAHVIEYAIVDDSVIFEQRKTLNVDGVWLGRVNKLAICQNLDAFDFLLFHCDSEWDVLGVAGYDSVDQAKAAVERSYHGLTAKWIATGYSREQAENYVADQFKGYECSFCGKIPPSYQSIAGDGPRICNHCVDSFYEFMHRLLPDG